MLKYPLAVDIKHYFQSDFNLPPAHWVGTATTTHHPTAAVGEGLSVAASSSTTAAVTTATAVELSTGLRENSQCLEDASPNLYRSIVESVYYIRSLFRAL